MTSPTPAAPPTVARPLVLLLLVLGACGSLSRAVVLQRELVSARDPVQLRRLVGREPGSPMGWLVAAHRAQKPEDKLALVERGLRFLPGQPDLVVARVSLLRDTGRHEEQVRVAHEALSQAPPPTAQSLLHALAVEGLLTQGDPDAAAQEALKLGAVEGVPPTLMAEVHARIALAQEFLGQADAADASFDASLDWSPVVGPSVLRDELTRHPERTAAALLLARRAGGRHPGHPDLALFAVWNQMRSGELDEAESRLDELPDLPPRLAADVEPLRARIRFLQGRIEEGLAILRKRLERWPGDGRALAVLIESWRQQGVPDGTVVQELLAAARPALRDRRMIREVDAVLAELETETGTEDEPTDPQGDGS